MPFDMRLRVMRVDRASGQETGQLATVVSGGSISRNQDTTVGEQATLELVGDTDLGADLLRIWADLAYSDGTGESIPLGTFLADGPKRQVTGGADVNIPLTLYGRLRELDDDQFTGPVSIAKGANPMDWIDKTIREAGLTVAAHDACAYRMGAAWTFGAGDTKDKSKLDAINALLDLAGWSAAATDPWGRVLLTPYRDPAQRAPSWEFVQGEGARFLRSMTDERDWFDTANQVRVIYATQAKEIIGIARDETAGEFSIPTRGRVISKTYTYTDVPDGKTDAQLKTMANQKAKELLATAQAVIHRVTLTHIYAPINVGDVIHLDYPSGGIEGDFAIRTQKIRLEAGLPVECEARSFQRGGTT
ncbi:hypothetical protein BCUN_0259 [Bifidobacterium cuniculi]|uniref:Uncharacterized protein n=3 Tax=Bifidobacterium cuniculi TaxID=1688 RepID=A0A087B414_9BIFI|nr:hypothetical protein BCUN_0259 [Bifidobacterium cuniculi]